VEREPDGSYRLTFNKNDEEKKDGDSQTKKDDNMEGEKKEDDWS
jgi:hypothetical protein